MQSVRIDGDDVFLAGVRDQPDEAFRYLRIPADDNDSVREWMSLRAALANPALREQAAQRYARAAIRNTGAAPDPMREQVRQSALRSLTIFAGDGNESGFTAVSRFLQSVPAAEQEKAADIFMKILNGSMWELWQLAREQAGLKTVFQVTRAPGKKVVYLGCLLLVLGVFSMLYIRERRLWVWIRPDQGGSHALMAMSTQRRTLDFDQEVAALQAKLTHSA